LAKALGILDHSFPVNGSSATQVADTANMRLLSRDAWFGTYRADMAWSSLDALSANDWTIGVVYAQVTWPQNHWAQNPLEMISITF
jgi:hypothetical protein